MKLFVNNKKKGKYILLFAVFSVLFAVIPYTDDDLRYDSLMEVLENDEINSFSEYLGSLSWRNVPGFSLNEYKKLCKKLYKYMSIYDRH